MLDGSPPFSCRDNPSALAIDTRTSREELLLVFSGEADAAAGPVLSHALLHATNHGHSRITIDLTAVSFIDAHCLSILFDSHAQLRERGTELFLRSPQAPVRRLLDILERQDLIELS